MGKCLVVYATRAGSSKTLAAWIGAALLCDTVPVNKCKQSMIYDVNDVVYIGGIRMNRIFKYKKFVSNMNLNNKRLVTVAVGMTYPELKFIKHLKEKNDFDNNASEVTFAYLQGALDINKVKTRFERFILNKLAESIEGRAQSSVISNSEKDLIACVREPKEFMRTNHILPIVQFLDPERAAFIPANMMYELDERGHEISDRPCIFDKDVVIDVNYDSEYTIFEAGENDSNNIADGDCSESDNKTILE